jgi:hypothetical protein
MKGGKFLKDMRAHVLSIPQAPDSNRNGTQASCHVGVRIWRDFGSALPFQTRLTQTKPVLPLPNEYGSQVKDQGRWQCCHSTHNKFPYRPTRDVSLLTGHAS